MIRTLTIATAFALTLSTNVMAISEIDLLRAKSITIKTSILGRASACKLDYKPKMRLAIKEAKRIFPADTLRDKTLLKALAKNLDRAFLDAATMQLLGHYKESCDDVQKALDTNQWHPNPNAAASSR